MRGIQEILSESPIVGLDKDLKSREYMSVCVKIAYIIALFVDGERKLHIAKKTGLSNATVHYHISNFGIRLCYDKLFSNSFFVTIELMYANRDICFELYEKINEYAKNEIRRISKTDR